jgi:hypothetical protein
LDDYRYAISLRIRHPDADPERFTTQLGMEPSHAWRAGGPRMTPAGTPLPGVHRETYWTSGSLERGGWPGRSLTAALKVLLDELEPQKFLFRSVCAEGGRVEFFIGWYFTRNSGDVVDAATLKRMGDLGIDLSLDLYPPDQSQTDI